MIVHVTTHCAVVFAAAIVLCAAAGAVAVRQAPPHDVSKWVCNTLATESLAAGAQWQRINCTAATAAGDVGPMVFNVVQANLSDPTIRAVPLVASNVSGVPLQSIDNMAKSSGVKGLLAGVNGGYFFRLDVKTFFDDVCFGKTRADALNPPSLQQPNYGPGDGLVLSNGRLLSSNCDCVGYSKPAVLVIDGANSHIVERTRGSSPNASWTDAIAGGPMVLHTNASGSFVGTLAGEDNVNVFGHSSNTALGLTRASDGSTFLYMVTADGHNGCAFWDPACGIGDVPLGYFLRDHLNCTSGTGMDQGGSTTMWLASKGIVSNPGSSPRAVFSGLFLCSGC